jgi:hypothetical protein
MQLVMRRSRLKKALWDKFKINARMVVSEEEIVQAENLLRKLLALQEGTRAQSALVELLELLAASLPPLPEGEDFGLSVSVLERLTSPAAVLDQIVRACLVSPFPRLSQTVQENLLLASGIDPTNPGSRKALILPSAAKEDANPHLLASTYLRATPFVDFFRQSAPFAIPAGVRFEHTHILGGSGHGKTQLLQTLILRDLDALDEAQGASLIVIDSQGDMISTITRLAAFSPRVAGSLADRLVLIDPNDIDHPPCLNLFDFGLERLAHYGAVEREKLLNGAIALYEYMFGALLGAELTERQGVIFRYLGRLLMTLPGATIHTLVEFMEDPEAARPHFARLEGSARHFFETQFTSAAFKDTRQQILNRLWGILSNAVLERLFSNERNKINIFEAMNSGKIILINTAKDLLKHDGCAILGCT